MTTKSSASVAAAKKKLRSRIAAVQKHADAAKKESKLAKLGFRSAKQAYKDARRAAKKLRKGLKKLKGELAALTVKRRKPASRKIAAKAAGPIAVSQTLLGEAPTPPTPIVIPPIVPEV